jgi:hypothetical protein
LVDEFLVGSVQFLGYGLGRASVLVTHTLALFKEGSEDQKPCLLASEVLLVLAGAYMIIY